MTTSVTNTKLQQISMHANHNAECNFALSLTYLDKNDVIKIQNDILLKNEATVIAA